MMSLENTTQTGFCRSIHVVTATLLFLLAATSASAQMNIATVTVTSGPAYVDGILTDYFIDPELIGTGIASVTLSVQQGGSVALVQDADGIWACDEVIPSGPCENFPTLNAVRALGELTFSLTGTLGETDTVVVPFSDWDPGTGQPGIPTITAPSSGEIGVALDATFSWNAAPLWVDLILAVVEIEATGADVDEAELPSSTVTWAPSGMPPGTLQEFRLSFFEGIFIDDPRASAEADAYLFSSAFESFNYVPFRTVANVPLLGGLGASALTLMLIGSGRRLLRKAQQG